jgi:hypothetical protein
VLLALLYSCLRLLLDVVDIKLRLRDPEAELLLLRHQLRVVRRQVKRPDLEPADRMIMAALSRLVNREALVGILVRPETVLRPHRCLDLQTPIARSDPVITAPRRVVCHEMLGGVLREYSQEPLSAAT